MQQKFSLPLAVASGRPVSSCRLLLRFLREAGLVPGAGVSPSARHIARIVMALAAETAISAPEFVGSLRGRPLTSAADLPIALEDTLTRIVEALPDGPVVGDLDIDGGHLRLGESWAVIEALSLAGKRAVVAYGERPDGIHYETIIPIETVRQIADAIARTKP